MNCSAIDNTDLVSIFYTLISESAGALVQLRMDVDEDLPFGMTMTLLDQVRHDVRHIFTEFIVLSGQRPSRLATLNQEFRRLWGRQWVRERTLDASIDELESWSEKEPSSLKWKLPFAIESMRKHDDILKSKLAGTWEDAFELLVTRTAACFDHSSSVSKLKQEYMKALHPHSGTAQPGSNQNENQGGCARCTQSYWLLELPIGSPRDAVAIARREMARSFHPDAWVNKRGAKTAEEQLKEINVAYDHLSKCPLSPAKI